VAAVADRDEIDATGSGTESHAPRTVPFSVSLSRLIVLASFERERNDRFGFFQTKRMTERLMMRSNGTSVAICH